MSLCRSLKSQFTQKHLLSHLLCVCMFIFRHVGCEIWNNTKDTKTQRGEWDQVCAVKGLKMSLRLEGLLMTPEKLLKIWTFMFTVIISPVISSNAAQDTLDNLKLLLCCRAQQTDRRWIQIWNYRSDKRQTMKTERTSK